MLSPGSAAAAAGAEREQSHERKQARGFRAQAGPDCDVSPPGPDCDVSPPGPDCDVSPPGPDCGVSPEFTWT
ncbi:hypothetical protein WMY93_028690 [Mugilogobius chulae]|uniref:Uncharacterized protein n=1 Tax=Mugilogobius chulae TaxID=88201 RepID=A0AAW0MTJ5_9GOBI